MWAIVDKATGKDLDAGRKDVCDQLLPPYLKAFRRLIMQFCWHFPLQRYQPGNLYFYGADGCSASGTGICILSAEALKYEASGDEMIDKKKNSNSFCCFWPLVLCICVIALNLL